MNYTKAISPVVATALLLVVAVTAVVGFQSFFNNYSSGLFSKVETQSNNNNTLRVEGIIGNILYIKSGSNQIINILKISDEYGNKKCELNKIQNSSELYLLTHINFDSRNSTHFFDVSGHNNPGLIRSGNFLFGSYVFGDYAIFSNNTGEYESFNISSLSYSNFPQEKGTLSFFLKSDNCRTKYGNLFASSGNNKFTISCKNSGGNYFSLEYTNNSGFQRWYWNQYTPNWDLVTFSYNFNTYNYSIYKNNILLYNTTFAVSALNFSNLDFIFGVNNENVFDGFLDEVRLYNTTLSQKEIENIYYFNAEVDTINITSGINQIPVLGCNLTLNQAYNVIAFTNSNKVESKVIAK